MHIDRDPIAKNIKRDYFEETKDIDNGSLLGYMRL